MIILKWIDESQTPFPAKQKYNNYLVKDKNNFIQLAHFDFENYYFYDIPDNPILITHYIYIGKIMTEEDIKNEIIRLFLKHIGYLPICSESFEQNDDVIVGSVAVLAELYQKYVGFLDLDDK